MVRIRLERRQPDQRGRGCYNRSRPWHCRQAERTVPRDVDVGDHMHLRPVSHGKPILGKKDRDPRVGFSAKRFLVKA
jgi:hypothetical protein